jgi:hypothetical protein
VPNWILALKNVDVFVSFSVRPELRASVAAATQFGFDDGVLHTPDDGEFDFRTNRRARFSLLSSAAVTASFGVAIRVKLKVVFDAGIIEKTLVDVDYSIANPVLDAPPIGQEQMPVSVEARSGSATIYKSFSGSSSGPSIATGIAACYDPGKVPQPEAPPKPGYTPGDASDLFDGALWPCNVCVYQGPYTDENGALQGAQVASLSPSANAASFECDQEIKNGCADLCTYNPTTKQLTKVKDAEQLVVRSSDPNDTKLFDSCDLPPPKP